MRVASFRKARPAFGSTLKTAAASKLVTPTAPATSSFLAPTLNTTNVLKAVETFSQPVSTSTAPTAPLSQYQAMRAVATLSDAPEGTAAEIIAPLELPLRILARFQWEDSERPSAALSNTRLQFWRRKTDGKLVGNVLFEEFRYPLWLVEYVKATNDINLVKTRIQQALDTWREEKDLVRRSTSKSELKTLKEASIALQGVQLPPVGNMEAFFGERSSANTLNGKAMGRVFDPIQLRVQGDPSTEAVLTKIYPHAHFRFAQEVLKLRLLEHRLGYSYVGTRPVRGVVKAGLPETVDVFQYFETFDYPRFTADWIISAYQALFLVFATCGFNPAMLRRSWYAVPFLPHAGVRTVGTAEGFFDMPQASRDTVVSRRINSMIPATETLDRRIFMEMRDNPIWVLSGKLIRDTLQAFGKVAEFFGKLFGKSTSGMRHIDSTLHPAAAAVFDENRTWAAKILADFVASTMFWGGNNTHGLGPFPTFGVHPQGISEAGTKQGLEAACNPNKWKIPAVILREDRGRYEAGELAPETLYLPNHVPAFTQTDTLSGLYWTVWDIAPYRYPDQAGTAERLADAVRNGDVGIGRPASADYLAEIPESAKRLSSAMDVKNNPRTTELAKSRAATIAQAMIDSLAVWAEQVVGLSQIQVVAEVYYTWAWASGGDKAYRLSNKDYHALLDAIGRERRGQWLQAAFSWVGAMVSAFKGNFVAAGAGVAGAVVGMAKGETPTERAAKEKNAGAFTTLVPRFLNAPLYSTYNGPEVDTAQLAQGHANTLDFVGAAFNRKIDLDAWLKDGYAAPEYAEPFHEEPPLEIVTPPPPPPSQGTNYLPWVGLGVLGLLAAVVLKKDKK